MPRDYCDGIDRRGFLRVGSFAGLSLAQLMQLQAAQGADKRKKDVQCICIFIIAGMANNNVHPSFGSMVARLGRAGALPPYISLPNFLNSGGPAFLGASCAPFVIEADPASPDFSVRDIVLPEGISSERSIRRQEALRR